MVLASELPAAAPGPLATTGKVMASLVLILVMIAGMALLARRLQHFKWLQNGRQDDVAIRTAGVLNLGVKEKLVVVDVGGKRLLLGVTAQQITTLAELPVDSVTDDLCDQPLASRASYSSQPDTPAGAGGSQPVDARSVASGPAGSQAFTSVFADVLKKTLTRV